MKILPQIITSRANPTVKWLASLSEKKGREKAKCFIAEGEKLAIEAGETGLPVSHLVVAEGKMERLIPLLREAFSAQQYEQLPLIVLSDEVFSKASTEMAPQGVICVIKYLDFFERMDIIYKEDFCFNTDERIMVLASVRDPSNIGAVIRSAVAFGVDRIVMSSDCADVYNPKVIRAAMGSIFKVKITIVLSLADFVRVFRECGRRIFAAELTDNALPLSAVSLSRSDAVIIGNEGHGIPTEVSALCNASVYIPISSKTESLNASVAASVFMWEQSKG